jgi:hypothetical protein
MKTTWHIVTVCIVLAGLAACSSGTLKEPGMASSAPRGVTMHEPGVYKGDKDDLIAKMQQQQQVLIDRLRLVQTDR